MAERTSHGSKPCPSADRTMNLPAYTGGTTYLDGVRGMGVDKPRRDKQRKTVTNLMHPATR